MTLAQKQNNQWRFGNKAGISFNTNPPSGINAGALQTPEGSASISDKNTGNILFHTDGVTIWNANNQPMPNGTGLLGSSSGELSSTTAAVIIPKPGSDDLFYVVTADEQYSPAGVRYSEVDMRLNNGLGDVVSGRKNIALFATSAEKLHVVPTADGCGYWLITHRTPGNSYAAFKVTATGINPAPVLSNIGSNQSNGAGHIKVNRQFNRLATGNFQTGELEIFEFDNNSGTLSNPIAFKTNLAGSVYGVEFSPNGKLLYVSDLNRVVQYDISSGDATAIVATAFWVSASEANYIPATLQLGPDDKIYIAAGTVDVIANPDSAGAACNFSRNAVTLLNGGSGYGLPGWIYSLNRNSGNTIITSNACFGKNTAFSVSNPAGVIKFNWTFNDPNTGGFNTSNLPDPMHQFSAEGNYKVRLVLEYACYNDTIYNDVTVGKCSSTGITGIKFIDDTCSSLTLRLSVTGTTASPYIFWRFGDAASGKSDTVTIMGGSSSPYPTHTFSAPGVYNICAYFQEPGQPLDSVCQSFNIAQCCIAIIEANDSCFNSTMRFRIKATSAISSVTWDFADNGSSSNTATGLAASHVFSRKGAFTVRATVMTPCGVVTPGFLVNIVDCQPVTPCTGTINVEGICSNLPIPFSISGSHAISAIRWNFGDANSGNANQSNSLNPVHKFTLPAGYLIEAIVNFDCGIDTIRRSISLEECNNRCEGSIYLRDSCLEYPAGFQADVNAVISSINWNFGDPASGSLNQSADINPMHIFSAAGVYNITANIKAACGEISLSRRVKIAKCGDCIVSIANAFSPNGDGINDAISPLLNCVATQYEWQVFNRWGQLVFTTNNSLDKWTGRYHEKPLPAGIYYYKLRYYRGANAIQKSGSIMLVR